MKKKIIIVLFALLLSIILILSLMLLSGYRKNKEYKLELQNEYSKNLSELNSAINSITMLLYKAGYTASPTVMSSFAAELYSEAELAKNALSGLPLSERPETLNRFLSQVGNYALSLSKSIIRGEGLSEKQQKNLQILSDTAKTIAEAVALSDTTYNNSEYWAGELEQRLDAADGSALADNLTELEENLTDYPTLIYDGPYSDHIITKSPIYLENKPEISREDALNKAMALLDGQVKNLEYVSEDAGKISVIRFKSENIDIAISKKGGYPVYLLKSRQIGEGRIDYSKAVLKAEEFLEKTGYKNMRETYFFTDNGVCVINFAFVDGQTLCYTDLIKVGVALDDGEIVFLETTGYLYNHTERSFKTPTYTLEEARQRLNSRLSVKETKIALIPSDGTAEKRCYEFLCTGVDGREMLIYINVNTLDEEQIFILLKTDGGTLVK